jgi:hypothetical protein
MMFTGWGMGGWMMISYGFVVAATPATYQSAGLASPRCSTSRHRATNSSRDTWRFRRAMASTARAVTSMHLIVTQHTDRWPPITLS